MQITLSSLLSVTRPEAAKGSPSRSYLRPEDTSKVLGFKWSLYKTGNIRRASFGGNEISNAEMRSVLHSIEGVYYDKHEKTLKTTESFCEMLSRYPKQARTLGYDKKVAVRVRFLVDETGRVEKTVVVSKKVPKLGFEEAALRSIGKMEFEPIRLKGKPIKVWFVKTIHFSPG